MAQYDPLKNHLKVQCPRCGSGKITPTAARLYFQCRHCGHKGSYTFFVTTEANVMKIIGVHPAKKREPRSVVKSGEELLSFVKEYCETV